MAPLHPIAQIRHQAGSTISYQNHRYIHCCRCWSVFYCLLSLDGPLHAFVGLIIISRSTARMFQTCSMQWAIEQVLKSLCQRMTTAPSCDLHHVSILQFYLGLFLDCHSIYEVYGILFDMWFCLIIILSTLENHLLTFSPGQKNHCQNLEYL